MNDDFQKDFNILRSCVSDVLEERKRDLDYIDLILHYLIKLAVCSAKEKETVEIAKQALEYYQDLLLYRNQSLFKNDEANSELALNDPLQTSSKRTLYFLKKLNGTLSHIKVAPDEIEQWEYELEIAQKQADIRDRRSLNPILIPIQTSNEHLLSLLKQLKQAESK